MKITAHQTNKGAKSKGNFFPVGIKRRMKLYIGSVSLRMILTIVFFGSTSIINIITEAKINNCKMFNMSSRI